MKLIKCDICNNYVGNEGSTIHLVLGMIGTPKFEDLCNVCSYWLLRLLDERYKQYNAKEIIS